MIKMMIVIIKRPSANVRGVYIYICTNGGRVLVGWPPIKRSGSGGGSARAAIFVKVKMEGVAIGRKVDLSLCNSYEALFRTLERMFPNRPNDGKTGKQTPNNRHHYVVTYEDGDGDWMLVGDVPWEAFIRSVKRLKIHN
ncbi:Auxin-responsive protein IAA20 [Ananas comosus]|uniref:Auxin-responsive protein n=1 Tax=Ananas comosus TaxID=4615 RepID=A0A199UI91_ANACO|nr:Auxin-responsive protein IAA20 [Ananas comosus]